MTSPPLYKVRSCESGSGHMVSIRKHLEAQSSDVLARLQHVRCSHRMSNAQGLTILGSNTHPEANVVAPGIAVDPKEVLKLCVWAMRIIPVP